MALLRFETLSLKAIFGGGFEFNVEWVALESFGLFSLMRSFSRRLFSKGWTLAVFSISGIGVVLIAPRIILSPAFCILFSFALFVLAGVHHEVEAYSKSGLTDPV